MLVDSPRKIALHQKRHHAACQSRAGLVRVLAPIPGSLGISLESLGVSLWSSSRLANLTCRHAVLGECIITRLDFMSPKRAIPLVITMANLLLLPEAPPDQKRH